MSFEDSGNKQAQHETVIEKEIRLHGRVLSEAERKDQRTLPQEAIPSALERLAIWDKVISDARAEGVPEDSKRMRFWLRGRERFAHRIERGMAEEAANDFEGFIQ